MQFCKNCNSYTVFEGAKCLNCERISKNSNASFTTKFLDYVVSMLIWGMLFAIILFFLQRFTISYDYNWENDYVFIYEDAVNYAKVGLIIGVIFGFAKVAEKYSEKSKIKHNIVKGENEIKTIGQFMQKQNEKTSYLEAKKLENQRIELYKNEELIKIENEYKKSKELELKIVKEKKEKENFEIARAQLEKVERERLD
jgi:hypothetical protein